MEDKIVEVLSNNLIATNTYKMVLKCDKLVKMKGGQFVHIALNDLTHPLRRPFCIADYSLTNSTITIVYAVVGAGTEILSKTAVGTNLKALYPLGNGFELNNAQKSVVLLGGGLGAAVLPSIITNDSNKKYHTLLGFASKDKIILAEELKEKGSEVYICTDDGTAGYNGFVTNLLEEKIEEIAPDVILCCGPEAMYKSLLKKEFSKKVPIFVSLEKRMGCGIGACLVCNCKIRTIKGDKFLRACVDGPVFNLNEVVL